MKLGIGPIAWVNDDIRTWGAEVSAEAVLHDIRQAGFAGTEMSYKFPSEPQALADLLGRYGLELAAAYAWLNLASAERQEDERERAKVHIGFCAALGAVAVVAEGTGSRHWDRSGPRDAVEPLDEAAWERLCRNLEELGAYARDLGTRLAFHPHAATPVEREEEIDRLLSATDPELVFLCYDSGHVAYGGGDPVAVLRRHGARLGHVHAKDVRLPVLDEVRRLGLSFVEAVRRGVFCPPGAGGLDFPAIWAALRESGYDGWIVVEAEQDPAEHPPLDEALRARRHLREVAGL